MLRLWMAKAWGLLSWKRDDPEFDEEVESHIDLLRDRYMRRGMPAAEAAAAARRQFGNLTLVRERRRAQRSFLAPAEWWGDIRFGLRMLMKNPGSNAAVVLALALGIGMTTAAFSFVNALLLRPPAGVQATAGLVEIWLHNRLSSGAESSLPFTYPDYAWYRDHSRSLEGLLAFDGDGSETIWNRSGRGQTIQGQLVSGNYFSLLGVRGELGRMIAEADDQPGSPRPVVVLSHSFWQQQLGGDPCGGTHTAAEWRLFQRDWSSAGRIYGPDCGQRAGLLGSADPAAAVHAGQDQAHEPAGVLAHRRWKNRSRSEPGCGAGRDAFTGPSGRG